MDQRKKLRIIAELTEKLVYHDKICCDQHRYEIAASVLATLILRNKIHPGYMISILTGSYNNMADLQERDTAMKQEQEIRDNMIANSATAEQFSDQLLAAYGIRPPSKENPRE